MVVIFAQGRTGSTLLEDLLSSTKYFQKYGEVLNCQYQEEVEAPVAYINHLSSKCSKQFLCHIKIYHLTEDRRTPLDPVKVLQELNCPIIYLYREDLFAHAISNIVLENYRIPVNYKENREFHITVKPEEVRKWIDKRQTWRQQEEECLSKLSNPILRVNYERDLLQEEAHLKTINRILSELRIPLVTEVSTKLKKTITQDFSSLITNWKDFSDF